MSFDIKTISIPQLPQVMDPLVPGSQITNGENADTFTKSIAACYDTLNKYLPTDNEQRKQKYSKLDELRGRIDEFAKTFSSHAVRVKACQIAIKNQMKDLHRNYQTNSHWLAMTAHRSHFEKMEPTITAAAPTLKLNPYNVQSSLDVINKLSKGVEKLRALHYLKTAICDELIKKSEEPTEEWKTKKTQLKESLRKVDHFAEFNIPLQEKFTALKQVVWRDKDAGLAKEMRFMIDPSGKDQILYFLQKAESMEFLISALCMVLKDRSYNSPSKTPLEILLEWPSDHNQKLKHSDQDRKRFVQELLILRPNFDDLFMQLTCDYLGNFFDPTGRLRCKCIVEANMTDVKKSREFAQVISSMCRFNLDGAALVSDLLLNPSFKDLGKNISFPSSFEKKLSVKEMMPFVHAFKAEAIKCFLQFDLDAYMKTPKNFNEFYRPLDDFHTSFRTYFKEIVKHSKAPNPILQNLTLLASNLANKGEYNLSFMLYLFLNQPGGHRDKKEFKFLENLFRPNGNMGNMRKFFTARVEAGELCIPWLAVINQENIVLAEQIDQIRQKHQKEIIAVLDKRAPELFKLLLGGKKIDESLEDWADSHLFDNWELLLEKVKALKLEPPLLGKIKASLDELLQAETELKLAIEKRKWNIHTAHYSFKLFYKDYKTAPAMQKVVDAIKASKE